MSNIGKSKKIAKQPYDIKKTIDALANKITYIQDIISDTIRSIKHNKKERIFSDNEVTLSVNVLTELFIKTKIIYEKIIVSDKQIELDNHILECQTVINKLSTMICGFGTKSIDDLLFISFGTDFKNMHIQNPLLQCKYNLIKKYIQPIGYKVLHWKPTHISPNNQNEICANKIIDEDFDLSEAASFECFDIDVGTKSLYQRIYGIRVVIQNEKAKKSLLITGIIEDIQLDCIINDYVTTRLNEITSLSYGRRELENYIIIRLKDTITLKDILINGNDDIIKRMFSVIHDITMVKQNKLEVTMKVFLDLDTYSQRGLLINLLTNEKDDDVNYISYLLYEMLSINSTDSEENQQLQFFYDSLPYKIKKNFKEVVKHSITTANDRMQKYDVSQVSLEQQIYFMKADDIVKEKAMLKLKEIKGKPDEMGLKAKQYLEGLIKIPFGVYREEPSLKEIKILNEWYRRILTILHTMFPDLKIATKKMYTVLDIVKGTRAIIEYSHENIGRIVKTALNGLGLKQINLIVQHINMYAKTNSIDVRLTTSNQTKPIQIQKISELLKQVNDDHPLLLYELYDKVMLDNTPSLTRIIADTEMLNKNINKVEDTLTNVLSILDSSIYAHNNAKNQIMKIIGQWMNGEQTGYCFGFEGSPGIGKTSMAKKGLSNCLKDVDGSSRPFSFIALGGSCNGSTIEGHGYTYMNSTWGKIVDILMDAKCMNPIIYIDELDKVSKTENGREIIGIFTHLIDQTQNDTFQDKYFSGINIDLSKALFIFSYNDPEQIDRILLDRIHRIKFENLTLDDKMVIVKKYILPEINTKMGFDNIVEVSEHMIEHIIEKYTSEPGVRKLKELLFDLYGEINLDILKNASNADMDLPIVITEDNLENKYLTKYHKIIEKTIHKQPEVGIINGLWANALGKGGIIPIQTLLFPSTSFLELRLTGLQGDVMKESMNVAKTLAWNLTPNNVKKELITQFKETQCQGLHIHCPEGAVSKDGPSAGAAITIAIFSTFNNKKIRNNLAITGEINLQGEVTAIGGLDMKITGGIKAGIKTFLYPDANHRDYLKWKKTAKGVDEIVFYKVSTIQDVFKYVFSSE